MKRLLFILTVSFIYSTTINVPDDFATIQEALNYAIEGDTVLVSPGTYYENIIWPSTNGIKLIGSGQDNCFIDGGLQEQCPGWGLDNTTYMCNEGQYYPSYGSVIRFLGDGDYSYGCDSDSPSTSIDSSTVISGFTIQNGYGDSTPWNGGGGGMQIWHSSPTLIDLTFSNNDGVSGGAMYICNSNSTITNVLFNENTIMIPDESGGAAIFIEESSLSLTDVVFSNNFDGGTNGGAIHIANWNDENMNLTLTNAVFSNNYAGHKGGALYVDTEEGDLTLTNVQFIGNQSYTGAIHINCLSNATLTNVEFIDNIAHTYSAYWDSWDEIPSNYCDVGLEWNPDECSESLSNNPYSPYFFPGYGGGLSLYDSSCDSDSLIMSNVLFQGNSAARGGGLHGNNWLDYLSITNATFVDNIAYGNPYTDARYGAISGGVDNLTNTIIWNNTPDAMPNESGIVSYSNIQGGEDWGEGNIDTDPLFVDPDNGDFTLQSSSPCIDAGDPDSDLDPDGTRADMGVYYFHQAPEVLGCTNPDADNYNPDANEDDGSCCIELWGECYNILTTTDLNLGNSGLNGEIPVQIGKLTNLTSFLLDGNQLTGQIPIEIGNLINLTYLDLHDNQLTGQIPIEIGNLTNLEYLYLYENEITSQIPNEIGNLENLFQLRLENNQLSGQIPFSIGNMINLRLLNLGANQLTGELPVEIGNLTNLTYLGLYTNNISGEIPSEIGNLVDLQDLRLGANQIEGEIPVEIGNLSNLYWMELWYNQLSGLIPLEVCDFIESNGLNLDWILPGNNLTNTCEPILGDINEDFELNVQDIIIMIDLILEPGYAYDSRADMNEDGVLNIYDIIILINIIFDN